MGSWNASLGIFKIGLFSLVWYYLVTEICVLNKLLWKHYFQLLILIILNLIVKIPGSEKEEAV